MKNLILILICITNFAFSQVKPNNDLAKMNINGNVKSILRKTYFEPSGVVRGVLDLKNPSITEKIVFNRKGNIKKIIITNNLNKKISFNKTQIKEYVNTISMVNKDSLSNNNYTFDNQKNWIRYKNRTDMVKILSFREIKYY